MKSIIQAYKSNQAQILRDLKEAAPFIKNIAFKNTFYRPREYNFSTDVIDFTITVNKTLLKKILDDLNQDKNFNKFLKDNFKSYDGFISFTPDNYQDLKEAIETNNQESDQAIGALIQYLTYKNNTDMYVNNTLNEIESTVQEYWSGNGYCGLKYSIVE